MPGPGRQFLVSTPRGSAGRPADQAESKLADIGTWSTARSGASFPRPCHTSVREAEPRSSLHGRFPWLRSCQGWTKVAMAVLGCVVSTLWPWGPAQIRGRGDLRPRCTYCYYILHVHLENLLTSWREGDMVVTNLDKV